MNLGNANIIKALLIDFLEQSNLMNDYLIGNEIYYGSRKRLADLVAINRFSTAFEIKSSNDDYRMVRQQLDDYSKVFDYYYLVTTIKHIDKAVTVLKENEGLILIDENGEMDVKIKAKRNKKIIKLEILNTIPLLYLKKHFEIKSDLKPSLQLRQYLNQKSKKEIRHALISFFSERLFARNQAFIEEKGSVTHFEDLRLLIRSSDKII